MALLIILENSIFSTISTFSSQIDRPRSEILVILATLKAAMSAPVCRISTFDPPFDAPGSGLSNARRINAVRQTYEAMATFL